MPPKQKPLAQEPEGEASSSIEDHSRSPEDAETASTTSNSTPDQFPVVGIGASAGGLEALEAFLRHVPADTGAAFVVVTHQHPGHSSLLPGILTRSTLMPVNEVSNGVQVVPNHIYISHPGENLSLTGGAFQTTKSPDTPVAHSIDYFFRSLAKDRDRLAIGVVLSGTGTDGTLGVKAIKNSSGMVMAQLPLSAAFSGMPSSAIATGLVDFVLPPEEMPGKLVAYLQAMNRGVATHKETSVAFPEKSLHKIFVLLRSRTGHDFSGYKRTTIRRRIERRMNVHQIANLSEYVRFLQENVAEVDLLFKDLLICVTNFFRDSDAFAALAEPLRELMASRPEDHPLRVWVPGCATGEEVYSLAILFRECMDQMGRHHTLQIFGTDLDQDAIEIARAGQYPDGISADVSPERLKRYFIHNDQGYAIRKDIRELAIFAPQNVIKDPPFTKLDLLCCRNLLIYLDSQMQKQLLPIFHYALNPGGVMFLGPSESVGGFSELFETLNKRWKIYRRKEALSSITNFPDFPIQTLAASTESNTVIARQPFKGTQVGAMIERLLLARFAPPTVVVNDRGDIVYIHGRTGDWLEPATGQPKLNVLDMAREGLQHVLPSAIRQASALGEDVTHESVKVKSNGSYKYVTLTVSKVREIEAIRGLLLVSFRPIAPPLAIEAIDTISEQPAQEVTKDTEIVQLERELQYTKESLQTTVEELEASNEELKSTNEELQSTNEELQSTNEELETSKEEMQSLNEELTTVNSEMQSKVEELSEANNDMQNLLNATDIATIFLDEHLCIKRYTEEAKRIVLIRPTDIGRPIGELSNSLGYDRLVADAEEVLRTLVFQETEVQSKQGERYLMRIVPYRTTENVIQGLVMTFVNIDHILEIEQGNKKRHAFLHRIVATIRQPLVVLDADSRVIFANRAFLQTFQLRPKQVQDRLLFELADGTWDNSRLRQLIGEVLSNNSTFEDLEMELPVSDADSRTFFLNARRLEGDFGLPKMILLAMEDVTH